MLGWETVHEATGMKNQAAGKERDVFDVERDAECRRFQGRVCERGECKMAHHANDLPLFCPAC